MILPRQGNIECSKGYDGFCERLSIDPFSDLIFQEAKNKNNFELSRQFSVKILAASFRRWNLNGVFFSVPLFFYKCLQKEMGFSFPHILNALLSYFFSNAS